LETALVAFIRRLKAGSLGADVHAAVSLLLRDQLAVQVGCSQLPWSQQVLTFARGRSLPGRSRVLTGGRTMSAADAAFVNAIFGHGFEYDDAHRASASHPGCCVVPAAIAIAEETGATLEEVIEAIVVGYEVYTRIGCLAAPELLRRGYHPAAVLSTFGAAAVAAKLRGFDAETTLHALAIALSHAAGTTEYSSTGGSVKRVHAGIGVRGGMMAAELARAGITGPRAFLTGSKGFYETFIQRGPGVEPQRRFDSDQPFEIKRVWIKPYCCCGCNHAYIDAVRPLAGQAAEIERLEVKIQRSANVIVGTANINTYTPSTIEHVQYSLPTQMAFTLLGLGNGYEVHRDYLEGRLDMAAVMALARRIEIIEAPELDTAYPGKFVADVTVRLRGGRMRHAFVEDPVGTAENPLAEPMHDAKFLDLTRRVLGADRASALLVALKRLGSSMRVADLTAMCAAPN